MPKRRSFRAWEAGFVGADEFSIGILKTKRGWTNVLIQAILGEPDRVVAVDHPRLGHRPYGLYDRARVEEAERHPDFVARKSERARIDTEANVRSAALFRCHSEETMAKAMALADGLEVQVLPLGELRERSVAHALRMAGDRVGSALPEMSEGYVWRLEANFVRHSLTGYDKAMSALSKLPGRFEASAALRLRLDAEIARVYPHLASTVGKPLMPRRHEAYRGRLKRYFDEVHGARRARWFERTGSVEVADRSDAVLPAKPLEGSTC